MNMVEVKDLSYSYGTSKVLDSININIEKGDFACLIGANGSGKSTLMKLILGEMVPDEGEIILNGKKVKKDMPLPGLAYVGQMGLGANSTFPASSFEVVSSGIWKGLGKKLSKEDKDSIQEALDLVDMGSYRDRNIGRLSGGQARRVLLARALVAKPQIIMLDEPTAGVDKENSIKFYELLSKLNKEKSITILTITHELERIYKFTDRVFCIEDGTCHQLREEEILKEVEGMHHHPERRPRC